MNHLTEIYAQCQKLPEEFQREILDFIYFLEARYALGDNGKVREDLTDAEVEQACAVLKAPRGISLAQMDAAIKQRGGEG